jgi:cytochrome c-type biogenesis protein
MSVPGVFTALLAGFLSFISPCVLPLVPAYLSFISGASGAELASGSMRTRVLARSLGFSAGFTLAFAILGVLFSGSAMFVGGGNPAPWIGTVGGIVVIVLGLNMMFDILRFLDADKRLIAGFSGRKSKGMGSAAMLGFAFAAGWSPCIGPILASILLFAARQGDVSRSLILLGAYSLGLAIPFVAAGIFFDRAKPLLAFLSRKGKTVRTASGIVLIAFGIAMAAGSLNSVTARAVKSGYLLRDFTARSPLLSAIIGAVIWLAAGAALYFPSRKKLKLRAEVQVSASGSGSSRKRLSLPVLFGAAALALAIAELVHAFSLLGFVASWLTWQGI